MAKGFKRTYHDWFYMTLTSSIFLVYFPLFPTLFVSNSVYINHEARVVRNFVIFLSFTITLINLIFLIKKLITTGKGNRKQLLLILIHR
jgi:hypothetical protein